MKQTEIKNKLSTVKRILNKDSETQEDRNEFFQLEKELLAVMPIYEYEKEIYGEMCADVNQQVREDEKNGIFPKIIGA